MWCAGERELRLRRAALTVGVLLDVLEQLAALLTHVGEMVVRGWELDVLAWRGVA